MAKASEEDHERWRGVADRLFAAIGALQAKESAASLHLRPPFRGRLFWHLRYARRNLLLRRDYDRVAGDLLDYVLRHQQEERERRRLEALSWAMRHEFSTTDPQLAIDYLGNVYGTSLRFGGARDGRLFKHARSDGTSFAVDDIQLPANLSIRQTPAKPLIIGQITAGRMERECAGRCERLVPGDIFAHSDSPTVMKARELRAAAVTIDVAVLAQVAATSPARAPGPVRLTGYRPISPVAAQRWNRAVAYLRAELADGEAQPLVMGAVARLLAATVLTTFPNTALVGPTAQDRRDATSATARAAVAYIEEHAHRDLSVADISAAVNVSIRAVQFAFRRHLDTTPMAYLRRVRLERAHRDLLAADPRDGVTVTMIAARWGFLSHSRFAARYRRAYDVTPRHTLHS
ncbi:hypothetical protein GCM10023321_80650 [Pseudonocardia eucalypti]|uniref:HTH araC/xylS-type domain-containing protein n=1 Tax=Pseudonocardia eucalypti TaxID=648755 RepID=A0ABP9RDI6_9PSEU